MRRRFLLDVIVTEVVEDDSWWLAGGIDPAKIVAAYAPKGAASLVASYVNLANPGTYNAAPGVAPTFDTATGWTFDGTTQYLSTGFTPSTNPANRSAIIRFSDVTNDGALFGFVTGNNDIEIFPNRSNVLYDNGTRLTIASVLTEGVLAVAGDKAYRNGVAEAGTMGPGADAMGAIYVGARNFAAAINLPIAGNIQAFALYNATLTADEIAAVTAAMQAL